MASLKDIKNRIKGVKSTQKITKAMKMISTARLSKAKVSLGIISQYSNAMQAFLNSCLQNIDSQTESNMPFIQNLLGKKVTQKKMVILFTTDKGLCGALNTLTLRAFENAVSTNDTVYVIGKKGFDYCKTRHSIYNNHPILSSKCKIEEIIEEIFNIISQKNITEIDVVFPHFVSTMVQKPSNIPLPNCKNEKEGFFQIDEDPGTLLANVVKHYVSSMLQNCLAELICCEHSARMIAMDNATNNATKKISSLTLTYNKTRQANITREILEIISGSQAV